VIADFPLPELAGLPEKTMKAEIDCVVSRGETLLEMNVEFERKSETAPLWLSGFEIKKADAMELGHVVAARPPSEGPVESVKGLLEAVRKWDAEKIFYYISESMAAQIENRDEFLAEFKAEMLKEDERAGFSVIETVSANLPALIKAPSGTVSVNVDIDVAAEIKGQKGVFAIEIGAHTDKPSADRWAVWPIEAVFRKAGGESDETPDDGSQEKD
jgi:hypothetical protein